MTEKLLGLAIGLCLCYISYQVVFKYQDSISDSQETNIEQLSPLDMENTESSQSQIEKDVFVLDSQEEPNEKGDTLSVSLSSIEGQEAPSVTTENYIDQSKTKALEAAINDLAVEEFDSIEHYDALISALRDGAIQVHEIDQAKEYIGLYLSEVEAELTEVLDEY